METASLRIKFFPLIKNVRRDDSQCYLEILPEVSSIQNLDKIEWKQDNCFYEYTIPMNYKIILKKNEVNNEKILDKTYHSCVDLLHEDSVISTTFASGDVIRYISDNFIPKSSHKDNCNIKLAMCPKPRERDENVADNITTSMQTAENSDDFILIDSNMVECTNKPIQLIENFTFSNTDNFQAQNFNYVQDADNLSVIQSDTAKIKIIERSTSTNKANFNSHFINNTEMKTQMPTKYKIDSQRKLSLSPICSVNTENDALVAHNFCCANCIDSSSLFFRDSLENGIVSLGNSSLFQIKPYRTKYSYRNIFPQSQYELSSNVPPDVRIAYFKNLMEKEMSPVQEMLNIIIKKCVKLGSPCISPKRPPEDFNSMLQTFNDNNAKNNKKNDLSETAVKAKSNRVVYSIAFDG